MVFKTAENHYRNQFFYSVNEQYGTVRTHYQDIGECGVLRLQADHEKERAGVKSGATAEQIRDESQTG